VSSVPVVPFQSPFAPKSLTLTTSANLSGKLRAVVDPVALIGAITLDVAFVIGMVYLRK
jgi:hypothetical protein